MELIKIEFDIVQQVNGNTCSLRLNIPILACEAEVKGAVGGSLEGMKILSETFNMDTTQSTFPRGILCPKHY